MRTVDSGQWTVNIRTSPAVAVVLAATVAGTGGCAPLHAGMSEARVERVLDRTLREGMSVNQAHAALEALDLEVSTYVDRRGGECLHAELPARRYLPLPLTWSPVVWEGRVSVHHDSAEVRRWEYHRWLTGP